MKRGTQATFSLGGTVRLVPAARSPLAVPPATDQPDAEGPMELAGCGASRFHDSAQVCDRTFKASERAAAR